MKIKEISVTQTKQIQQFHPRVIGITAEINEGDNPNERLDELIEYIDYKLNKPERDNTREKILKDLEEETDEHKKTAATEWLAKYDELEAKMAALEFIHAVSD